VLRWPRSVAQVESIPFGVGMPPFSALFLSNLIEYRHKSYIAEG